MQQSSSVSAARSVKYDGRVVPTRAVAPPPEGIGFGKRADGRVLAPTNDVPKASWTPPAFSLKICGLAVLLAVVIPQVLGAAGAGKAAAGAALSSSASTVGTKVGVAAFPGFGLVAKVGAVFTATVDFAISVVLRLAVYVLLGVDAVVGALPFGAAA